MRGMHDEEGVLFAVFEVQMVVQRRCDEMGRVHDDTHASARYSPRHQWTLGDDEVLDVIFLWWVVETKSTGTSSSLPR